MLFQIGDFLYDRTSGELYSEYAEHRVEPKTAQVLDVLISHQGRVVSRAAILEAVWSNRIVVDEVVTRCIAQLRRALGDEAPHRYIETLPKRGYRLIAPVGPAPCKPLYEQAMRVGSATLPSR